MLVNNIPVQSSVHPENPLSEQEWFLRMGISTMANPEVNPLLKRYLELEDRNKNRAIEREKFLNPHVCNMDNLVKVLKEKEVI